MTVIYIHRPHTLGLERAHEVALQWVQQAEHKLSMQCCWGDAQRCNTLEFKRPGVSGHMVVAPDHFELTAQLGFLLSGFSKRIEAEIEHKLDELLSRHAAPETR